MISLVEAQRAPRTMWAFWIAAGLAVVGGLAPLVVGLGTSSRISGVIIPFGVGAAALAANALIYHQGRPLTAILYFVAGIAIVYGILSALAVPLRLAVIGTCPGPPAGCPAGFEKGLSAGEDAGLSLAVAMGILAILTGFFGLFTLYRQRAPTTAARPTPSWPERDPATKPEAPPPAKAAPKAEPAPAAEPIPELEAPAPVLELPAPEPEPEPAPKPRPRPRVRRTTRAKLPPEPPSTPSMPGEAPEGTSES